MALNPYQQAVSDLAKRLGLRGAAESQVYQRPEYLQLVKQLFGSIPLPAGIDPSQVIRDDGAILEYRDNEGYVHRLVRDLEGTSSQLGQVREGSTNRPAILPPPPEQRAAEQGITNTILKQLQDRFSQNPITPPPPALPDFSGLQDQFKSLFSQAQTGFPAAPQMPNFSNLFGQLNQPTPNAPQMPDLSGLNAQYGNLQGQLNEVFQRLMGPSQLAQLQPGDLQNLQAIKAASDAQLNDQFQAGQSNLLARLYGQGVNQSTIANQATADLLKSQGLLQLQGNADAAARQLGLQQFLTQQGQGNLALAGQTAASGFQGLGQQGQLALGQGQLALGGYQAQNDARLQQLGLLSQSMLGQGNLALGAYDTESRNRIAQLQNMAQLLLGQGQLGVQQGGLALSSYEAGQTAQNQAFAQAMQQLQSLMGFDLQRQVASGELGLGQAQLAEQIRQNNNQLSMFQEQQRAAERAARDAFTRQLIGAGIGLVGGIATGGLGGLFGGGAAAAAAPAGNALGNTGSLLSNAAMRGTRPIF